jgi:hypothetical protein
MGPVIFARPLVTWAVVGFSALFFAGTIYITLTHLQRERVRRALVRLAENPQAPHRFWWCATVDYELFELFSLAGWWDMSKPFTPHVSRPSPTITPVQLALARALGYPLNPNLNSGASRLLTIAPQMDFSDPLTIALCELGWSGHPYNLNSNSRTSCVFDFGFSLELVEAVAHERPLYVDEFERDAAVALAEFMRRAVTVREGIPRPAATLAEFHRNVRRLLSSGSEYQAPLAFSGRV